MTPNQTTKLRLKTACLAASLLLSATALAGPSESYSPSQKSTVLLTKKTGENKSDNTFRQDASEGAKKEPLRINPGDKRPGDQFKIDVFGHPLTIGGAYELEPRFVEDRRLDPQKDDDTANIYQDLKLEFFYEWSKTLSFFVQSDAYYDPEVYSDSGRKQYEAGIKLTQAWFFIHQILGSEFSMQIGRQRMADKRQWWWNEELDATRIYFGNNRIFAEISLSRDFGSKRSDQDFVDPFNDRVTRLLGDVIWEWAPKQNISLLFLSQFDSSDNQDLGVVIPQNRKDISDGDLTWIGTRALGKFKVPNVGKIGYWLDSAFVFGNENTFEFNDVNDKFIRVEAQTQQNVLAWGMDAGLTWYSNLFLEPYLTMGYAYGSGDTNPHDGINGNYRQSGIHNNKVKFSGSQRFRYYGELFRPELSNLQISTAAIGVPLSELSSIDLLYHHYKQANVSETIRDSRIRATPNGQQSNLGDEVDLVVSLDEWKHLQMQFAGSLFIAGEAYGRFEGNTSYQLDFTVKYSF